MKLQKILILLEKQLEAIEAPVLKKLNAGINSREMLQKEGLPDCLLNCTQCINGRMASSHKLNAATRSSERQGPK